MGGGLTYRYTLPPLSLGMCVAEAQPGVLYLSSWGLWPKLSPSRRECHGGPPGTPNSPGPPAPPVWCLSPPACTSGEQGLGHTSVPSTQPGTGVCGSLSG